MKIAVAYLNAQGEEVASDFYEIPQGIISEEDIITTAKDRLKEYPDIYLKGKRTAIVKIAIYSQVCVTPV